MDKRLKSTATGIGLGIVGSAIWELTTPPTVTPGLEHYHVGLLVLIGGARFPKHKYFLYGVGAALVAGESAQEGPFGIGDTGQAAVINLTLAGLLGGTLLAALSL